MATRSPKRDQPRRPTFTRRAARATRDATLGSRRGLGLWILPLLVLTGALGASLAGGLAVLYYSQRVAALEETVVSARAQLDEAAESVEVTATDAREAIEEQVRQVREQLAEGLPVESVGDSGVVPIAAFHDRGEIRTASAFAVFSTASETFLVTTYEVVATPEAERSSVGTVEVLVDTGVLGAEVFNVDPDVDLAILRLEGITLEVLDWRPVDESITRGDQIVRLGVAGIDTAVIAEGRVAAVGPASVLTTLPPPGASAGGPLLDAAGRVVAVASASYTPFGADPGAHAVPVAVLCENLLQCAADDVGGDGTPGPGRTRPTPAEPIPGFTSRPPESEAEPEPDPEPEPEPEPEAESDDDPEPGAGPDPGDAPGDD